MKNELVQDTNLSKERNCVILDGYAARI